MARTQVSVKKNIAAPPPQQEVRKKRKVVSAPSMKKKKERIAIARVWDNCVKCGENLKTWGITGTTNGFKCPPCVRIDFKHDIQTRKDLEKRIGKKWALVIPVDTPPYIVDANKSIDIGVAASIYHSATAYDGTHTPYNAYMSDTARLDFLPTNHAAISALWSTAIFDSRSEYLGTIVIRGPLDHSLYMHEIDECLKRIDAYRNRH